jgi:hypothetical protein
LEKRRKRVVLMKQITGVIFPINENQFHNIIENHKNVYAIYSIFNHIKENDKLQFYVSKTIKKIKIEARVESVDFLDITTVKKNYSNSLIMDSNDFSSYIRKSPWSNRENKKLLVLVLKNIKECNEIPKNRIPVSGMYIRE